MKIICQKEDLQRGVSIVSKAVPTKTTMPILECILIDAQDGTIHMTANDMELGIETVVTGMVEMPGKIALEAKVFSEIVRRLPDNEVSIETDESGTTPLYVKRLNSPFPAEPAMTLPICLRWSGPRVFLCPSLP